MMERDRKNQAEIRGNWLVLVEMYDDAAGAREWTSSYSEQTQARFRRCAPAKGEGEDSLTIIPISLT